MDKPKITPKDFFLWVSAMAFLYVSVFAFVSLIFDYLNYLLPDALQYYASDPYSGGISYEMASLIVLFPIFLVLMRIVHRDIQIDASRAELWIRRWALYLTLFIAGVTVAGDLITLIMYFFNGDVTLRFALKVLVILLVALAGFSYFFADLRGYWERNPSKSILLRWATVALVLVTIVAGFFIVGTPWQARLYRFDDQKVSDLQNIQYQIVNYWQLKQKLPTSLINLNDPIAGVIVPVDPQTGEAYEYSVKAPLTFELCATFNAPTQPYAASSRTYPVPMGSLEKGGENDVWQHAAGRVCFTRPIDPELHPPYPTKPAL
ncbi:MAG: DUF5671 domain-containing protein [bacterium]|nr:DUF5671 domain-containing protein [bacterium]